MGGGWNMTLAEAEKFREHIANAISSLQAMDYAATNPSKSWAIQLFDTALDNVNWELARISDAWGK
jgi:hypothetical protein